ncbi:MAG: bifunctional metallophosphatase/5'-nucleotidase [Deltaproteobacteria bacterium]|nr:bifunctional metallophosphatase/5'-nucleotidase [Deltaproteobacteria bacterium]
MPLVLLFAACIPVAVDGDGANIAGLPVHMTFLHTSDIHSRLFEYHFEPSFTDETLGLAEDLGPYGGLAEIAYILRREREQSGRVLHVDSGDSFQGAVVFNEFDGEAEFRALTAAGLNAAVLANHEFDKGASNLATQAATWAGFDLLAANYDFADSDLPYATELEDLVLPSVMFDVDGLRVGIIGMGNLSSLNSIYDQSNSMGIRVIEVDDVIPSEAAKLRAEGADIVVLVSHMGLDDDIENATNHPEIDLILGGHHHVALDPPLVVTNEQTGKRIPIVHSGAFAKFVGRLDIVVQDGQILSHDYQLFPVDNTVPQDPEVAEILEEYQEQLDYELNLDQVIGYAEEKLLRYGTSGGDSMLGNLTAEAMRFTPGVETEIALTNTLGIRADIPAGDITLDVLYNSMPFDNTITTMFLSGRELQELLDYVTSRSTERGCQSQAQVAGIRFTMDCRNVVATDIYINGAPLSEDGTYELATNNYIAHGGSGFEVLERNTTQVDTGVSIRDVVKQAISGYGTLPQAGACEEDGRILAVY